MWVRRGVREVAPYDEGGKTASGSNKPLTPGEVAPKVTEREVGSCIGDYSSTANAVPLLSQGKATIEETARSRSRENNAPCCFLTRSRRFATPHYTAVQSFGRGRRLDAPFHKAKNENDFIRRASEKIHRPFCIVLRKRVVEGADPYRAKRNFSFFTIHSPCKRRSPRFTTVLHHRAFFIFSKSLFTNRFICAII